MRKSQLKQDVKVIEFYKKIGKCNDRYFVEIGASDGIQLSNTYLLEKKYNWKGICIEPIPYRFENLCKNRSAICSNKPIFSITGKEVIFDISNRRDFYSGISEYIDVNKKKVDKDKTTINLTTISLTDLLDMYNAPKFIDYLSLDTEGSELEILKGIDYNKYIFGLIDVEHNYVKSKKNAIKNILTENGYIYLGENKHDDQYVHSSVSKL